VVLLSAIVHSAHGTSLPHRAPQSHWNLHPSRPFLQRRARSKPRADIETLNRLCPGTTGDGRRGSASPVEEAPMNGIIYLVGLIVVIMFILSALGLR
jgi:hypothetical protein